MIGDNFLQTFCENYSARLQWPFKRDRKFFPKRLERISNTYCVITQKSEVLICFATEAWNIAKHLLLRITSPARVGLWRPSLQRGLFYKGIYFYTNVVKDGHKKINAHNKLIKEIFFFVAPYIMISSKSHI